MKRIILLLTFVLLSMLSFAQWNTYNMLQMGKSAIYFDDYVSAIDNFNNIIRVKPYLPEPYFFRGLAKLNLDDYEGAIKDYSTAIDLNPNYYHAYLYRGIAYNNLKRYEEAMKNYEEAVSLNPGDAYAYANRGITKAEMGDFNGAEKDYSKALIIDNKLLPAYLNRAIMREKQDNVDGAMADCNAAIKLNMFSDDAFGLRGYLWYRQKDYHNAIDDYNRALKANPQNKRVLMSRAIAWYDMKKYQETLNDYSEVIRIDSNYIYAYYNRAMLRAEVGDNNNAIADLDKVVEMNPDNILIYFNRGLLRMEIRDYMGAYNDFTESIRLYPDFVKAYLARASVSSMQGDYASADRDSYKAREIMERYQKMKGGDRNALVDTTENFRRLIDINARDDKMREVINGRIQDKNVIIELQDIFRVQYLSLDSLRTGKVQYYNTHVMNFNQAHNYTPGITVSNKTILYPPDFIEEHIQELTEKIEKGGDTDNYLLRGAFYMNRNQFTEAINDFNEILERQPGNLLATFNLANARMKMYDYIESVEDKTVRIVGEKDALRNKTDYSLVIDGLEQVLQKDPSFVFALFNLANVYAKSGEIEKAITTYNEVIRLDKDIAEAYFNRGLLYIYLGRKAEANVDLSKAGELGITEAYNVIKRYCKEDEV